jgi:anthranilate synthase/aminodeoxychorismate synthase-like glutamine amidotransferase
MRSEVLMIDNFDSFTFNLVEAFQRLSCSVKVLRNGVDAAQAMAVAERNRSLIVLSPGPGRPEDAGCCTELVALALGRVPLLGICLGHQAIVQQAGGSVVPAPWPVHGKASLLDHDGSGPLRGMDGQLKVGRYHSLCTLDVPSRFQVHARCDGIPMAISDPNAFQTGLQFHPESILTRSGDAILENILLDSEAAWRLAPGAGTSFSPAAKLAAAG